MSESEVARLREALLGLIADCEAWDGHPPNLPRRVLRGIEYARQALAGGVLPSDQETT